MFSGTADADSNSWTVGGRTFDLGVEALVMGVLNVTPDSFSDGGEFESRAAAVGHARKLADDGAAIVDIGGESTRPGAPVVSEGEELRRTIPVIEELRRDGFSALISIDTSKAEVARAALEAGADIVNDVTGLTGDPGMTGVVSGSGCGLVVMHMRGNPRTMQEAPEYNDVVAEVSIFLVERCRGAVAAGVDPGRIVVDPGIGFGKTLGQNRSLLRAIPEIGRKTGRPVLVGVSRKSMFAKILGRDDVPARKWPTVAVSAWARERGAGVLRVHDVKENIQAVRMTEAILAAG